MSDSELFPPFFFIVTEVMSLGRSKYNVSSVTDSRTYNGIQFDSIMEMKYYRDVVLPQAESGQISKYELQKAYELQPKYQRDGKTVRAIEYIADYYIEYADGRVEVIDIKGCPDSTAKIKKKMFEYIYPDISYRWVTYCKKYGGWVDYDYVAKQRYAAKKEAMAKAAAEAEDEGV